MPGPLPNRRSVVLDGAALKDFPALYRVPAPLPHELPVVGVWVDPRVTTGFKYRVRPLDDEVLIFVSFLFAIEKSYRIILTRSKNVFVSGNKSDF